MRRDVKLFTRFVGRFPRIPEMKLEICIKPVKNRGCFWNVVGIAINLDQAKVSVSARCGDPLLCEQLNHIAEPMEVNSSHQAFRRDMTRA